MPNWRGDNQNVRAVSGCSIFMRTTISSNPRLMRTITINWVNRFILLVNFSYAIFHYSSVFLDVRQSRAIPKAAYVIKMISNGALNLLTPVKRKVALNMTTVTMHNS